MKREFFDSNDTLAYLDSLKGPTFKELKRLEAGEDVFYTEEPFTVDLEVDQGQVARPNTIYNDLTRVAMNPGGETWIIPGRG